MKTLRIICGGAGALHYSASPELAMDTCPVCGEKCREANIFDYKQRKTLYDLVNDNPDAIEVDRVLCTSYTLELENAADDGYALEISYTEGFDLYEHFFTAAELEAAVYNHIDNTWKVNTSGYSVIVKCYNLIELKP